MKKQTLPQAAHKGRTPSADPLIGDIRTLIEETRSAVAVTVNTAMTLLYWRIGKRI